MHQRDNAFNRQRDDTEAQAKQRRGASATIQKNQRNNFEASAWRC